MRRFLTTIFIFVVLVGLTTVILLAEDEVGVSKDYGSVGDGVVAELLSDGTLLIRPSDDFSSENKGEMNDYNKTTNRPPYYSDIASIKSVRVSAGVTYIGDHAFRDMSSVLTFVVLEEGVTKIGDAAFNGATVESFYLPSTLQNIMGSSGAPFANSEITNLYYAGTVKEWCSISFSAKTSSPTNYATNFYIDGALINNLVIPDGVTKIPNYAFRGYKSLNSVTLPASVTSVGNESFNQCTALKKIAIPANISLGSSSFYTTKLEDVTLVAEVGGATVNGTLLSSYKSLNLTLKCKLFSIALDSDTVDAMLASYASAEDSPTLSSSFTEETVGTTRVTKIAFDVLDKNGASVFNNSYGRPVKYAVEGGLYSDEISFAYDGEYTDISYDADAGEVTVVAKTAGVLTVTADVREKPKFDGAYISLGDSISLTYRVSVPEECQSFEMKAYFEGVEYSILPIEVASGVYDYKFTKIMPYQMNDIVTASLYATYCDGKSVTVTHSGMSVKRYYELASTYYSDNAVLMTLLSDMLIYGRTSQLYKDYKTDSLVTDGLSGLTPSEYTSPESVFSINGASDSMRWHSAALYCTDSMGIYLTLSSSSDNVTVKVTLGGRSCEYDLSELTADEDGMYRILYTDIMAYEFSNTLTAELIDRDTGESVSTLTYSVVSYVNENENSSDEELSNMLKAIQCYGKSAAAYREER